MFSPRMIICLCFGVLVPFLSGPSELEAALLTSRAEPAMHFIENRGQLDEAVRYYTRTGNQSVFFTDEGMVFDLQRSSSASASVERLVLSLAIDGVRPEVAVSGRSAHPGTVNYFIGNDPNGWRAGIPTFREVVYSGAYDGIDLKVYGKGSGLELEFIVQPGADPETISLTYEGIDGLSASEGGELLIDTLFGELRETEPHVYQVIDGEKVVVEGAYELLESKPGSDSECTHFSYGFRVEDHDPGHPLIIDPTLHFSTYLGGSGVDPAGRDWGRGIAVDSSGNMYVAGYTTSSDFPMTSVGYDKSLGGVYDAFVTKFDSTGGSLLFSTYLGGIGGESAKQLVVDGSGCAYVAGYTDSSDLPTTTGAYEETFQGTNDGFVAKLNAAGSALEYCTYLGGGDDELCDGLALDSSGCAYVTGRTYSSNFPLLNEIQDEKNGASTYDVFVTKLNSDGTGLVYSTYLGGSGSDWGRGIAVDGSDRAHVICYTMSTDFPEVHSIYSDSDGDVFDACVVRFSFSRGTLTLDYSTYLGGSDADVGVGIAVDSSGSAYITGYTASDDFPMASPYQGSRVGSNDVFVSKLSFSGDELSLDYSTYLGGSGNDEGYAIAVDGSGDAYITGITGSSGSTNGFPTENPIQPDNAGGGCDAFVSKLSISGDNLSLVYSTYLGGTGTDAPYAIVVDGSGIIYATGYTSSSDFPKANPFQSTLKGDRDAIVFKYEGEGSTSIELVDFSATGRMKSVLLEWETASEIDTAGFHLWRSKAAAGDYSRITDQIIPSEGGASWGATYSFEDVAVVYGGTYYYYLEDIDWEGVSTFHGPVWAVVGIHDRPAMSR